MKCSENGKTGNPSLPTFNIYCVYPIIPGSELNWVSYYALVWKIDAKTACRQDRIFTTRYE